MLSLEEELGYLEARTSPSARNMGENISSVIHNKAKNDCAQMIGNLDKLQYEQIDAVITAELKSGKHDAKELRKSLNQRCEKIRSRLLKLHSKLT